MDPIINKKTEGNAYFGKKDYSQAVEAYTVGLDLLNETAISSLAEARSLKIALLSNRAACHLSLRNYDLCVEDCNAALSIDGGLVKPLFRRAQAYASLNKTADAFKDACMVVRLEPKNKAAHRLARELKVEVRNTIRYFSPPFFEPGFSFFMLHYIIIIHLWFNVWVYRYSDL